MALSRKSQLFASATLLIGLAAGPAFAGEVPVAIRAAGALHLSVNAIYPPIKYKDPATDKLAGVDIELAEATAKKLGLSVVFAESAFEQLIPLLATDRTDFILSGFSDLPARRETMTATRSAITAITT
jgi:polar amino acid transport system substrate-binding protein